MTSIWSGAAEVSKLIDVTINLRKKTVENDPSNTLSTIVVISILFGI